RHRTRAIRSHHQQLPSNSPPHRRPRHRNRLRKVVRLRSRRTHRRRRGGQSQPGGFDGQTQVYRDRKEDHPRGDADDGWLRIHPRIRHGRTGPPRPGTDHLRRHQRDPTRNYQQEPGTVIPFSPTDRTHDMTTSPFTSEALTGKRILITGGGTGLGRGVARHLVDHGAEVHLWGRRPAVLEEAATEASVSRPGSVYWQTVDVRNAEMVSTAMDEIRTLHGPLTGVINNAAA